jgi:hypothetical protein
MKTRIPSCLRPFTALTCTAAALLLATTGARAADDIVIDTFDTAETSGTWVRWWGSALQTYEWDGTVDAEGSATSGSLRATIQFDLAAYGGDNQFAVRRDFSQVDGSQYTNLVFDLLWEPTSPRRSFGDFGFLEPGFRNQDFTQNWLPGFAVSTNPG